MCSRGGYIKYTVPLNITKYLAREDEYVPWKAVENNLDFITTIMPRSNSAAKYLEVCAGGFILIHLTIINDPFAINIINYYF